MITEEQARVSVSKKVKRDVQKVVDWDSSHWVVQVEMRSQFDANSLYGVDKKTGEISSFTPAGQLEKFASLFGLNDDFNEDED